jgi:hypothetical protein
MQFRSRTIPLGLMAAGASLLAACQSASPPPPAPAPVGNFLNAPTSPDAIVDSDPVAVRLQDIGGYILLYYREHQAMPPNFDELRKIPGGEDLNFTSPSSGRPFAFAPAGIWVPNQGEKCIIAYDPARTPNGNRWCLFMMLPKNGAALSVDVVTLPEPMFLSYRPIQQ